MKHENPVYNISLLEARTIRDFLNKVGFIIREIVCNPNTHGAAGVTMVPEQNIPDDGQAYNLMFLFEGTAPRDFHQVTTVRDLVVSPSIDSLRVLHRAVWPSGMQADLDARLLRNAKICAGVNAVIQTLAGISEAPAEPKPAPKPKRNRKKKAK